MDELDKIKTELEIRKLNKEIDLLGSPITKLWREQPASLIALIGALLTLVVIVANYIKQRDFEFENLMAAKAAVTAEVDSKRNEINKLNSEYYKYMADKSKLEKEESEKLLNTSKDSLNTITLNLKYLHEEKASLEQLLLRSSNLKDSINKVLSNVNNTIQEREQEYLFYQAKLIYETGNFDFYSSEIDSLKGTIRNQYMRPMSLKKNSIYTRLKEKVDEPDSTMFVLWKLSALELLYISTNDSTYWKKYSELAMTLSSDSKYSLSINPHNLTNNFFNDKWDADDKSYLSQIIVYKLMDSLVPLSAKLDMISEINWKTQIGKVPMVSPLYIYQSVKLINEYYSILNSMNIQESSKLFQKNGAWPLIVNCPQAYLLNELKYIGRCEYCDLFDSTSKSFDMEFKLHFDSTGVSSSLSSYTRMMISTKDFWDFRAFAYNYPTNESAQFVSNLRKMEDLLNYKTSELRDTTSQNGINNFYKSLKVHNDKYKYLIDRWADPKMEYFSTHWDEFDYCIRNRVFQR